MCALGAGARCPGALTRARVLGEPSPAARTLLRCLVRPPTAALSAGPSPPSGTASVRAARPGTRSSRRPLRRAVRSVEPAAGRAGSGAGLRAVGSGPRERPRPLREVGAAPVRRMSSGIGELDRVLGGGLVPGSLVLLGGSPGIGKSTLTNMALGHMQRAGLRTLYVSGEESAEQVRLSPSGSPRGRCRCRSSRRPISTRSSRRSPRGTARVRDRLGADAPRGRAIRGSGLRRPGARSGRQVIARKDAGDASILVGHVTKEGALGGPARARAHRRLRAPVRGERGVPTGSCAR